MASFETREAARKLVSAAICDFIGSMSFLEDPIIIGGQYGIDKLHKAAADWSVARSIKMTDPACNEWATMVCKKLLNGEPDGSTAPDPE